MVHQKIVKIGQNTALVMGSVIFSLIVAELALRLTNLGRYSLYNRILFFTQPSLVEAPDKTVRYQPQATIRSVAIYGDQVDYDIRYRANNLGFIDDIDYDLDLPATTKVAFIGDSFTVGDGGNRPWITQLRKQIAQPDLALYNFGVTGAGILHFQSLLASLRKSTTFDEINILVIGNDFFRLPWYPIVKEDAMWFCHQKSKKDCLEKNPPVLHIANHNDSQAQLVERAKNIYAMDGNTANISSNFFQQLRLYTLICDAYSLRANPQSLQNFCPHLKVGEANQYDKNDMYQKSLASLQAIKNNFPGAIIRIVHIPEKGETFNNKYSLDLKDDIEQMGLQYLPLLEACDWDRSMYHRHDAHFNDLGYANLVDCLKKALNTKIL